MPRQVTVTFADGTQHVYQGVPDDATPDSVTARAQKEFGKAIVNIDGGRKEQTTLAQDFGRSAASLADVGLNAVTGTLDMLAYPLARAYYGMSMPHEQAAARAKQETTSPKDVVGRAFGVTETPQYQGEAARRITGAIGENIVAPVVATGAQITGAPESDVESVLGIGGMAVAPGAARAARPAVNAAINVAENTIAGIPGAARATVQAPVDVARGFGGAITGQIARPGRAPGPAQSASSRVPLGSTYIDPVEWAEFRAGQRPIEQVQPRPIQQLESEIIGGKPLLALAGREIPYEGQGMRAFGEALGGQYRRNPITGALDIAGAALTGIPPIASYRAAQGVADYILSKKGFTPNLPEEYAAAVRQADMGPPRPPGAAPTGPVAPAPIPPQNQMMLPLTNQLATPPEQFNLQTTPGFVPPQPSARPTIQQQVQEVAASRVIGMPQNAAPAPVSGPVAPAVNPQGQSIIDQIRARGSQQQQAPVLDFEQMAKNREADLALQARKALGESYQPPKTSNEMLKEMKLRLAQQNPNPAELFEDMPLYTDKEATLFERQQATARKGYGTGETVSEIEVMSAENRARKTGLASDRLIAEQLRQRLEDQTAQGIVHVKKAPPGVTEMKVSDYEGARGLDLNNPSHVVGSKQKPLANQQEFLDQVVWAELKGNDYAGYYKDKDGNTVFEGRYPSARDGDVVHEKHYQLNDKYHVTERKFSPRNPNYGHSNTQMNMTNIFDRDGQPVGALIDEFDMNGNLIHRSIRGEQENKGFYKGWDRITDDYYTYRETLGENNTTTVWDSDGGKPYPMGGDYKSAPDWSIADILPAKSRKKSK